MRVGGQGVGGPIIAGGPRLLHPVPAASEWDHPTLFLAKYRYSKILQVMLTDE
jgi:hypothetical protein